LELLTVPDILALGSRLEWKSRCWGISQQVIQVVATFDREKLIVVEQKMGRSRAGVADVTPLES
jgi:hypothetical protein